MTISCESVVLVNFTVVIPLFNKGPHVERAVRSALDQSLSPAEIIVVDDGSTDGGLEAVRGFGRGVKLLQRSSPGPGGYAARNLGIQAARSEWIAFLDADDVWRSDHLKGLSEAVAGCSEAVGCVFSRLEIEESGRFRPYPVAEILLRSREAIDFETFLRAWIATKRCPMWTGAVAVRRDVLLEAGLFPEGRAQRGGDKDMWLRTMALTKAAFAPRPTAEFHHDAVNRVSNSASHASLPILSITISNMLAKTGSTERRLLRQVNNLEIVNYARLAAGKGETITKGFFQRIYQPEGAGAAIKIAAYMLASGIFRSVRRLRTPS